MKITKRITEVSLTSDEIVALITEYLHDDMIILDREASVISPIFATELLDGINNFVKEKIEELQ